ncbi:hypothetical protein PsW64_00582 [Pseudovibrio sp. W64]|uniref:hypothetical protein n=1 Tax=unclassified Pseudovibrio TaxID=2627060 RepID=UPI00070EA01F|nr:MULTISPECIES: hypothetical protein [unclassified Pseudovibrio]KZK89082.1 hypothetical protein PsAD5_05442 [Pseudovibrio sp. Ad5]KZK89252.1 hypothetical protein PsW64_00582 [Pseudovibrio sp. W64]KZK95497.1 hypothetical protein PsAD46_00502 [Pseudovibrio sp. Ad46]KZL02670.1 hypothetical protein PsW74_01181 [Pseudovibrio sp. W74]KZL12339.1 hypothetical protein PsAD14_00507 [Pseudovibrio sp. Ad14]
MAVLMKFDDIDQVYKETSKIKASLKKAKVDEKTEDAFMKELNQKKKRAEGKFLDEVNNDSKIKNFKAESLKGDGGFTKALKEAAKRTPIQLMEASGKVTLKVGKDVVVGT